MNAKIDLIGRRFGRLLVITESSIKPGTRWVCKCDCGNTKAILGTHLKSGGIVSCTCYHSEVSSRVGKENKTHGYSGTKVYISWQGMLSRCENSHCRDYKHYGGRGITVCKRWHKIENFVIDMGHPPPGFTLERKNNDKGYYKRNCKWATRAEQERNRRSSRKLSAAQAREIKYSKLPADILAQKFNVKPRTVVVIRQGKTWKWV